MAVAVREAERETASPNAGDLETLLLAAHLTRPVPGRLVVAVAVLLTVAVALLAVALR